jgi:ABC-type glycerol-3-phosphate transport system substrate-binding protein
MRAIRVGLLIGLVVTMSAACAGTGAAPPLGTTAATLTAGWERHFTFEWATADQGQASKKVSGYVYNHHGEYAISLRVLAQAVDSGGAVVAQRIAFVPGGVGGLGRAYFEVPDLPATASYRLSVWDYTWFQSSGDGKI